MIFCNLVQRFFGLGGLFDMPKDVTQFCGVCLFVAVLLSPSSVDAQGTPAQSDSNVRPPVTRADLQIVKRAREILDSPSKWNRADNRVCPADARTFSLYCALEKATIEVAAKAE